MKPDLLSVRRAAARLGIAPRTLRRAIRAGELPGYRPADRTVYLLWPELLRWLRTRRVLPPGPVRHPTGDTVLVVEAIETEDDR